MIGAPLAEIGAGPCSERGVPDPIQNDDNGRGAFIAQAGPLALLSQTW